MKSSLKISQMTGEGKCCRKNGWKKRAGCLRSIHPAVSAHQNRDSILCVRLCSIVKMKREGNNAHNVSTCLFDGAIARCFPFPLLLFTSRRQVNETPTMEQRKHTQRTSEREQRTTNQQSNLLSIQRHFVLPLENGCLPWLCRTFARTMQAITTEFDYRKIVVHRCCARKDRDCFIRIKEGNYVSPFSAPVCSVTVQ